MEKETKRRMEIYKVEKIEEDGDNTKIFSLVPKEEGIKYLPGQFVKICKLEKQKCTSFFRFYSIASPPTWNKMEFCIKILPEGKFTGGYLNKIKEGEELGIEGPYGEFIYKDEMKNVCFIGGGTGIAPLIGILRYIDEKDISGKFTGIFAFRTKKDIIYKKEIERLNRNKNIDITITLTREKWEGEHGHITKEMLEKYVKDPKDTYFFTCGPIRLIQGVKEILKEIKPKGEKYEGWG